MSFTGITGAVQGALGSVGLPNSFSGNLQPDPSNTTTAVNLLIVVNGIAQGLIQSMRINEQFNAQRVKAVGSATLVATPPGVYEAGATISRAFIFGQTMEQSFGGNIRAVVGKQQANPDFTKLLFNIVTVDNKGNALQTFHDCFLNGKSTVFDIGAVIIMEDADVIVRWTS